MDARTLKKELEAHAGGSLVSIAEIERWSGRSRNYLLKHVLPGMEYIVTGKQKLFYSGDVAAKFEKAAKRY